MGQDAARACNVNSSCSILEMLLSKFYVHSCERIDYIHLQCNTRGCGCSELSKPHIRRHLHKSISPRATDVIKRWKQEQRPHYYNFPHLAHYDFVYFTQSMSVGYFPKREKVGLEDLFKGLVTACHILHQNDIFDAYGHISVRSPDNPATFWMPCNMPPALVSSPDDLIEYNIDGAEAVEKDAKLGYVERHIHSEIYKRFPAVNSVVHSHASDVLPYCVSGVPLKNTIHMAGFLGITLHNPSDYYLLLIPQY